MESLNKLQEYVASNSSKNGRQNGTSSKTTSSSSTWEFWKTTESDIATAKELENDDNGWFPTSEKDPCLPPMSKKQRILGFMLCLTVGIFCFFVSSFYIPVLVFRARKFTLLFSLGSLFFIGSFSMLWGPWNHIKHLFSGNRLQFTAAYFATLFGTLYFAMWVKSTILTVVFALLQITALVWYIVSYIPGGQTGLKFFSKIFYSVASKTVQKTLPV